MSLNHPAYIMENKDSAVRNFLGETELEVNPFEENLKDPFTQEETPEETNEEVEEKPLPFHKDPKIQKFIDKEISKRLAEIQPNETEKFTRENTQENDEVTDVLVRLIGNDTPEKLSMVKEFKNVLEKGTQRAKQEAIEELNARQYAEVKADQEAQQELETAFENIEETFNVDISSNSPLAKKTRQEFVTFVEKIAPKDRNGDILDYPDMISAFETYQDMKKATSQPSRAKELASRGMSRSAETTVKPQQKMNWDAVDSYMETLK